MDPKILFLMTFLIVLTIPVYAYSVEEIETKCTFNQELLLDDCFSLLEIRGLSQDSPYKTNLAEYISVKKSNLNAEKLNQDNFIDTIWDKDRVMITGTVSMGESIYWGIEGLWNSTYWNSSFPFCRNITHYQDDNPYIRIEEGMIYNFTNMTLEDCDAVRLISEGCGNGGFMVPFDVIDCDDDTDEGDSYVYIDYYVNRSYDGNKTYSLYWSEESGFEFPVFPDTVDQAVKDINEWLIDAETYQNAEFWHEGSGIEDSIQTVTGNNIGTGGGGGTEFMGVLHGDVTGNIMWVGDEDDVCTVINDGTELVYILCEAGEDSNGDGDCDSGETCAYWEFWKNAIDLTVDISLNEMYSIQLAQDETAGYWLYSTLAGGLINQSGGDNYVILNDSYFIETKYDIETGANRIMLYNDSITNSEKFRSRFDVYIVSGRESGTLDLIDQAYFDSYQTRTIIDYNASIDWDTGRLEGGIFNNPLKILEALTQELDIPEEPEPLANVTIIDYYCDGLYSVLNTTIDGNSSYIYTTCDFGCDEQNPLEILGNLCNLSMLLQIITAIIMILLIYGLYKKVKK